MRILLSILITLSISACSSSKKQAQSENSNEEKTAEINVVETETPTTESQETAIEKEVWIKRDISDLPDLEKRIEPSSFDLYHCDYEAVINALKGEKTSIVLPTLNGFMAFELQNSNTMNEALAAKFPNIKSYKGKSADGKFSIRLDTNDDGLFAEISSADSKTLISPFLKGNYTYYAVYNESAITPNTRDKSFE